VYGYDLYANFLSLKECNFFSDSRRYVWAWAPLLNLCE